MTNHRARRFDLASTFIVIILTIVCAVGMHCAPRSASADEGEKTSSFMTFVVLDALAHSLSPKRLQPQFIDSTIVYVTAGVSAESGDLDEARYALTWAAYESGGDPSAMSPDGKDCALLQQRGPARYGHSCDELKSNPVLSVRLWTHLFRSLRKTCGSVEKTLGAMSTGKCGGAPKLVRSRCLAMGGC